MFTQSFRKDAIIGIAVFVTCVCEIVSGAPWDPRPHVTLFDHENHEGEAYYQDVGRKCYNLPAVFDDRASSIDTQHNCIKVCTERDCRGCFRMHPGTKGHFSLKEIHLNDNISSFTRC